MKKKYLLLSFLFLLFLFPLKIFANSTVPSVVYDEEGLFSKTEIRDLTRRMNRVQAQTKAPMMIVTGSDLSEDDPRYDVDRTLGDYVGDNENGVLLYVDMENRQVYISTSGNMIHFYTDSRIERALDDIAENGLTTGDYYNAGKLFVKHTQENYDYGIPGNHYTMDEETGEITFYRTVTFFEKLIARVLAIAIALIFFITVKRKYQLKKSTYSYNVEGDSNVKVTRKEDTLIRSFVTTRKIPKSSSSGGSDGGSTTHSSGGGTFGGGSRSF